MGEDTRPGVPASPAAIIALAKAADDAGFDSVWTFDHLLIKENDEAELKGLWEAWTLLAAIAGATSGTQLGVLVSATSFRPPALLAKMAHTVNEISSGRLTLGVGAGWHEPEYTAFGYPFDHRVGRFAEAMQIITAMVRDGSSTFAGEYYRTDGALMLPETPGRPKIPVLVGGRGPRMMSLIAEHGDAWNTAWFGMPGPKFTEQRERMNEACAAAGRDPESLEVSVGVYIKTADAPADEPGVPAIADALADAFAAWRAEGVAEILCWMDPPTHEGLDLLASVLPRPRVRRTH